MCGIVGNDRALSLRVTLLKSLDLILLHVNGTEAEVNLSGNLLNLLGVGDNHILVLLGKLFSHMPSALNYVAVLLARASCARCQYGYVKPRVIFKKKRKALSYHTCCSDDSYLVLFHCDSSEFLQNLKKRLPISKIYIIIETATAEVSVPRFV